MSGLKNNVRAAAGEWERNEWFHSVGRFETSTSALAVPSWADAAAARSEPAWENAQLCFANELGDRVSAVSPDLYETWNAAVAGIRPVAARITEGPLKRRQSALGFPAEIIADAQWCIMHALLELHFADVVPPATFNQWMKLYLDGFVPCGWEGEAPAGRLIVL